MNVEFQLVVGDSPPIQDRETAAKEVVVINHSKKLASEAAMEEYGGTNINEHVAESSPVDETKKIDEGEASSKDIQVIGEAEQASEEGTISIDVLPRAETTPVVLNPVNDHPTRQASVERENSPDKVSTLFFCFFCFFLTT